MEAPAPALSPCHTTSDGSHSSSEPWSLTHKAGAIWPQRHWESSVQDPACGTGPPQTTVLAVILHPPVEKLGRRDTGGTLQGLESGPPTLEAGCGQEEAWVCGSPLLSHHLPVLKSEWSEHTVSTSWSHLILVLPGQTGTKVS